MKCIGALIGDFVGSAYEFHNVKHKNFQLFNDDSFFTDDSFMTLAVMDFLFNRNNSISYYLRLWGKTHPWAGYGLRFNQWIHNDSMGPYNSFGNGSAMRISPVGWIAKTEEEAISLSKEVTECTHNHPLGIEGAEVVAMCIFYAKSGKDKNFIKKYAEKHYNLNFSYNELVKNYGFDETCQGSVPQAIFCFLISNSFEDCLRTSISIGGDSDTIAAIACSIAEAYYKEIPQEISNFVLSKLSKNDLKLIELFNNLIKD